jgi:hypothetical protein
MKNITVQEFCKLYDAVDYDNILKFQKPKNIFCDKKLDLNKITYLQVRNIFKVIQKGTTFDELFEMFEIAFGITKFEFYNTKISEYYAARNYLIKFYEETIVKESKLLKSINIDQGAWQSAGGENLNAFSDLMPLVQIGEIYSIYPYDLQHKPYNEILTLLVAHKRRDEINSRYNEIKNKV